MRVVLVALAGWACLACAARPDGGVGGASASRTAAGLAGSLQIEVAGDSAFLTLHATNPGPGAVRLEFATAQRYDFEIWTLAGERVWKWSEGRTFAQVMSEEQLPAGATLRERVSWAGSVGPGEYVAVARLQATSAPLELRARFRVPVE